MIHREDAAWLAGLIDGEGCLDSPRGNPRLRIKMSDMDIVLRAAAIMGATTYREDDPRPYVDRKPLLVAQTTGDNAVAVMRAVLPWMGSRRSAKITEIVLAHAAKRTGRVQIVRRAA